MVKRLLLNFIMKNEAANLPRMLASVEPLVMGCAVTDTGSTDNSVEIVEAFFRDKGKPVWVNRAPFEDFSQARNAALRHARSLTDVDWDYLFLCDCDMELVIEPKIPLPDFTAACYAIMQNNGTVRYWNARMLRRDQTCEYTGRTHECIVPEEQPVAIGGVWFKDHETGANRVDKYLRDIELLTRELKDDPTNPRSIFYMVQSLLGAGQIEKARQFCDLRVAAGGLEEEIYWCLLQMARFDELLGRDADIVHREYLAAYEYRPTRAEPLAHLAVYLRKRERPHLALVYARKAALMPFPAEILPVELAVYQWMALDEWLGLAIVCNESKDAWDAAQLLKQREVPDEERERIKLNCSLVSKVKHRKHHRRAG